MNCGVHRGVKLLEHVIKITERMLERQIHVRALVNLKKMQLGFMIERGTVKYSMHIKKARAILKYEGFVDTRIDKKPHMCFVDMKKSF